jgi:hypothetical protein
MENKTIIESLDKHLSKVNEVGEDITAMVLGNKGNSKERFMCRIPSFSKRMSISFLFRSKSPMV